MRFPVLLVHLAAVLVASGCGPFSHKREPKELFPEDSLSRTIAQSVTVEPLQLDWRLQDDDNAYFSSVSFGRDSAIWVSDVGSQSIRRVTPTGDELDALPGFSFPYLIVGTDGVTAVYEAGLNRISDLDGNPIPIVLPPYEEGGAALARQIGTLDDNLFLKDAKSPRALLYRIAASNKPEIVTELPGAAWRHHGLLRSWGDKLISASSYRPVFYTLDREGALDSLRLNGFDSPMLARIRAYTLGTVEEPPLVISGIYGDRNRLYVINIRPGILRLDVYDDTLRLVRVLQFEESEPSGFTPIDVCVGTDGDAAHAYVASVRTVYGSLSLHYASRLDRYTFVGRR